MEYYMAKKREIQLLLTDICNDRDESQNQYTEGKEPNTKEYKWDIIYMKFKKKKKKTKFIMRERYQWLPGTKV